MAQAGIAQPRPTEKYSANDQLLSGTMRYHQRGPHFRTGDGDLAWQDRSIRAYSKIIDWAAESKERGALLPLPRISRDCASILST